VAERYEAASGQPPAEASLISAEENPLGPGRGVPVTARGASMTIRTGPLEDRQ